MRVCLQASFMLPMFLSFISAYKTTSALKSFIELRMRIYVFSRFVLKFLFSIPGYINLFVLTSSNT